MNKMRHGTLVYVNYRPNYNTSKLQSTFWDTVYNILRQKK